LATAQASDRAGAARPEARDKMSKNRFSFRPLLSLFSSDLAIDLGTSNTLVYAKGTERDFIMSPQQAKEYGIIDEIVHKHRKRVPRGQ
jgi:ATP-dependent protease ClpP protease subunit